MARRTHFFVQTIRTAPDFQTSWTNETSWQPRVDVYLTEAQILIYVEAAGVAEDDLKLHFDGDNLVIEGRRAQPDLPCPQQCLQVEIDYGAFRKVLALPRNADAASISARYLNGLLQITIPRRTPEARSINITLP